MNKFDSLIQKTAIYVEADIGSPLPPSTSGIEPGAPVVPTPPPAPQVTKLAPEGKRFLVELALKALAFNPDGMPDQDKGIFDEDVTPENTDQVLSRIRSILGGSDVTSSAENDMGDE